MASRRLGHGSPVVGAHRQSVLRQPVAAAKIVLESGQVDGGGDGVDPHMVGEGLPACVAVQHAQGDEVGLHPRRERDQQVPVAAGACHSQQDGEKGGGQQP